MNSDPKPDRRVTLTRDGWAKIIPIVMHSHGGKCGCGCGRIADSAHHIVNRTQGGDDVLENLVALAGDGTRLCHGALTSAQRTYDPRTKTYIEPSVVRMGIRRNMNQATIDYVAKKKGRWWLDSYYPEK